MNPDQIAALIKDFTDRAADAAKRGDQSGEHFFAVSADIVREHAADAARQADADPAAVARRFRDSAKEIRRAESLGFLRESVRCPV
jgi:hypothetical protein